MKYFSYRYYPHWLIGTMLLVFVVNGGMVYTALHDFPGAAGDDGFDLSRSYNAVMARAAQQAALGWRVATTTDAAHHPHLSLAGRDGTPLVADTIDAHAERPLGPVMTTDLAFHQVAPGSYQSDATLADGQWDVLLTITQAGQTVTTTQRVVVR